MILTKRIFAFVYGLIGVVLIAFFVFGGQDIDDLILGLLAIAMGDIASIRADLAQAAAGEEGS